MASGKRTATRWAVIRVPRTLYERIRNGQGTTLHETIARAMDAREDPKADRRVRELRAELDACRAELAKLQRRLGDVALRPAQSTAAARTLPLFQVRK